MIRRFRTRYLVLLLSGLAFTGCKQPSSKADDLALLSLFADNNSSNLSVTDTHHVVGTSDPSVTGCKINVTTTSVPSTPGSVTPGTVLTFEMEGQDSAHIENAGFIAGLGNSVGDLPATHSIIAPDVTTNYVLSVFTVDGVRTRNNNCEVTVNITPAADNGAPLPSCEIKANTAVAAYGMPLGLTWTSQNAVTAEVYPTNAVGVIASPDVAAGSWNYKSYYGTNYSMRVWNADGQWAQCSASIKEDAGQNALPTSDDSAYTVAPSATVSGAFMARDLENDSLTYSLKTLPTQGTVNITNTATGEFTYTANAGVSGMDSFTFTANDGTGDSNIATIRIQYSAQVKQIAVGGDHSCALYETGKIRCWGKNDAGQLGYGNTQNIGDNETPADTDYVDVGGSVKQIAAGWIHTCALLESGSVHCWGSNGTNQLGYSQDQNIGDNETPASLDPVDVGGPVKQISAGTSHTCALLETGNVRCWGLNDIGHLGYGHTQTIGDDETPAGAGDVNVGGTVKQIAVGRHHSCALLEAGNVRCWGFGVLGQLGYGNMLNIGDNETPADAGDVNVGGPVKQLIAGLFHTCALLESGSVRCWGPNDYGTLGYGLPYRIGDNETPNSAGDVNIGGTVKQLSGGMLSNCALLESGQVRCWGQNDYGQLGYANNENIGDNEFPTDAGDVDVGGLVRQISTRGNHTCALLESGRVRCWGLNLYGALGYGHTQRIGDNETPASAGDVNLY